MMSAAFGRSTTLALIALPVAVPLAYLVYINRAIRRSTTSVTGQREQLPSAAHESTRQPRDPASLPADVKSNSPEWVVAYERVVSNPIPISSLAHGLAGPSTSSRSSSGRLATTLPSPLLRDYLRATHVAFSWTPQAMLIRAMIKEADIRQSFDGTWIKGMAFAPGELVNGVYRVSHHEKGDSTGSERVELIIEVPASYKGPAVRGVLVAAIEPASLDSPQRLGVSDGGEMVVFVNETWMWRGPEEKPTMLETPLGKWLHTRLAGWLILKGLAAVVGVGREKMH